MEGLCVILSGGEYCEIPEELRSADYVIACDRGWQYAQSLKISPDCIVGDFDSAPPPDTDVPVRRFPTRKDDTDTMLAVRHAMEKGYRDIAICCALGGRLDHAFANIQSGAYIAAHGGRARLLGEDTDILIYTGAQERFPQRDGWSLSVFSLSDACKGVSIRGTKYECEDVSLTNTFPLGVSNVWAAENAVVGVKSGLLMVVQSKLRKGEHI